MESLDKLISLEAEIICYSHFGYYSEAVRRLKEFRDQTRLWTRVTDECVDEGLKLSEAYEKIREANPAARRLADIDEEAKRAVYSSLVGFVEYAKWLKRGG